MWWINDQFKINHVSFYQKFCSPHDMTTGFISTSSSRGGTESYSTNVSKSYFSFRLLNTLMQSPIYNRASQPQNPLFDELQGQPHEQHISSTCFQFECQCPEFPKLCNSKICAISQVQKNMENHELQDLNWCYTEILLSFIWSYMPNWVWLWFKHIIQKQKINFVETALQVYIYNLL